jgi:hypothetical protein
MTPQAATTGAVGAVRAPEPRQAGAPHIDLSKNDILNYLSNIRNKLQAPEHHRYETRPFTAVSATAAEYTPQVQTAKPKELKLHPDTPSTDEATLSVEQAGPTASVLITLIGGLKGTPEYSALRTALNDFIAEERALKGVPA